MNNIQFRIVFCSSAVPNLLYVLHKPVFRNACFQFNHHHHHHHNQDLQTKENPKGNFGHKKTQTLGPLKVQIASQLAKIISNKRDKK